AVLLAGCSDNFVSSDGPVPGTGSSDRIMFTRYSLNNGWMGIASATLEAPTVSTIIPGAAILVAPPQAGKMLYIEISGGAGIELLILKVADLDGSNPVVVDTFSGVVSLQLQDATLSPDGRTVAYVLSGLE